MHLELKARKNIHELSGMEGWMKVYHGNESFKNVQLTKEILCSRLAEYGDTCTDIKVQIPFITINYLYKLYLLFLIV